MQDYLINWNAGPLGVVLRPDLGLDMPPVVAQLLPQQSVLRMSGVRAGDMLISVNGKKTTKLGYDKVVKLLFKERLPIVLHFRVPSGGISAGDVEASNVSHATEPDYLYPQYQNQVLPGPPPGPPPSTPALPSERFTDASARSRPRAGSSVLGVPADFADAPPLVRVQSQPQRPDPHHHRQQQNQMQMVRGRRSQSTESVPRARKASSAPSGPRDQPSPLPADRTRHKRKAHKDRAEAEERRLRKQYSVVWERGSLGISFRAFNAKVDVPTVDFISAARGQGRGMERVCVNDVLIAVNGEKTKLLGVEKVLRWLHVVEKPVVLRFHSSSNRIPSNPVPQISNAPTLPPAPLGTDAPPQPHPPTRRNTSASSANGARHRRDSVENQIRNIPPMQIEQRFEDDDPNDFYAAANGDYDEDEFEQLYPQPDPPQKSGRRHSTDARDGPRLPQRTRDDSMHAYIARAHENRASLDPPNPNGQSHVSDDSVDAVGDFRREQQQPPPGLHEFDLRIDAHVVPREASRRDKAEDEHRGRMAGAGRGRGDSTDSGASAPARRRSHSSNQRQNHHVAFHDAPLTTEDIPPPPASPSSHSSGMHVGWNRDRSPHPAQSPSTPSALQRTASLSESELTLRAAVEVVARASGRPADQCEFAGVPLARIQDGSVQAKLLVVYARTCLAKEQAAKATTTSVGTNDAAASTLQLPPVAGNPLGRKGSHRQFLSYTITMDDETAGRRPQQQQQRTETASDHSARRPQHVPQYADGEQLNGLAPPVSIPVTGRTDAGDFIALQDFELQQDGSLTERRTGSSVHSSSAGSKAAAACDESASRSSVASSGRHPTHQVTSAGPLANGVSSAADHERPAPVQTPEPTASSVGSSLAEVLSATDSSAHPDVATFDDLIALPTGRQTPVEHANERLDDDEEEENEHEDVHEKEEEGEPSALEDARVAALFASAPDVHALLAGKRPSAVLTKKGMIDEIQEILDSLQMESQFERHSHVGVGTMPSPPMSGPLVGAASHAPTMATARSCCQCDKRSDGLAEMALGGREWYCQDCWEFFFFSEDREQEPSPSLSGERGSELDADAGSVDDEEAFKYSFHDSAFGRDDVLMMRLARPSPSRSPLSPGCSPRDSALTSASSVTEHGDEVWL